MWWNKKDNEEEGYNGIVPNQSRNWDSELYNNNASGDSNTAGNSDTYTNYNGDRQYDQNDKKNPYSRRYMNNENNPYSRQNLNGGQGSYSGSSPYSGTGYGNANGQMLDPMGREVKNRFVLKLILSIILIFPVGLLGILALVFSCLQNSYYKKNDWQRFRRFRLLSNIFLGISGGFAVGLCVAFLVAAIYSYRVTGMSIGELANMSEEELDEMLLSQFDSFLSDDTDDTDDADDTDDEDVVFLNTAEGTIDIEGMYTITYQDVIITLGETLDTHGDFLNFNEAYGFLDFDEFQESVLLGPGESYSLTFSNDEYNYGYMDVYNPTDEDQNLGSCIIDDICISPWDLEAEKYDSFTYLGTLTLESTPQDFIDCLGDDYDCYTYDGWHYYYWYTDDGQISATFAEDGEILESIDLWMYVE